MESKKSRGAVYLTAPFFTKTIIYLFIIWNLIAIPFSSSEPISKQNAVESFFLPYLRWTRLLQSWKLFVPTPRKYIMKFRADITLKDGTVVSWQRPYPPNWNFFERHLAYNFQKWDLASNYLTASEVLWKDLAEYLIRIYSTDVKNPPVSVSFIRITADVPPPNPTGYVQFNPSRLLWTEHVLFKYDAMKREIVR